MTDVTVDALRVAAPTGDDVVIVERPEARGVRSADFAWLWGGHTVSTIGDQVTMVALPLAVWAATGSALAVGIAASMEAATAVLIGLVAGALADRLRYRPVLVATDLVRGAVLALVAATLVGSASAPLGVLYLAAFVLGALRVLHDAAAGAALPVLVGERDLLRANGRLSASESLGNTVGPAMATGLIALGGFGLAFVADATSFVGSGLAVRRVRGLREDDAPSVTERLRVRAIRAEIKESLGAMLGDNAVTRSLVLVASMNVMAVCMEAQFIPYAKGVLHLSDATIGIYFAIGGLAGIVSALLIGRNEHTRGDAMLLGVGVFGVGVLLAGLAPSRLTGALAFIGAGAGSVTAFTHFSSLRQRRFPVRLLGRISMASRTVLFGVMPVAFVAGGALARSQGPDVLFVVSATVGLVTTAWMAATGLGRLRA